MAETILKIEGLEKTYRHFFWSAKESALKGISFEVTRGTIFGLVGPNGAGKTTTIKLILGLIKPDRGDISLFGRKVSFFRNRALLGYLPENPYFYDYLTANEILDFYGRLFGLSAEVRKERRRELIRMVGLEDSANKPLRKFSKGMLQRIGIAQALINDPQFLILDEPLSGLDPIGRKEIKDILIDLKQRGKTILFSSHIMSDVEMLCDRVALLVRGNLVSIGRLEELLHPQIRAVEVIAANIEASELERIKETAIFTLEQGGQVLFNFTDEAQADKAIELLRKGKGRLVSIIRQHETLEEYFMERIKESKV